MELIKLQIMKLLKRNKSPRLSQRTPLLIDIKNIGIVGFKRSYKAKRLILKIKEKSSISVSVPRGISVDIAINFVVSKTQWINKTLDKMSVLNKQSDNRYKTIKPINREISKKIIVERVKFFAHIHNFSYNRITIKRVIFTVASIKKNNPSI